MHPELAFATETEAPLSKPVANLNVGGTDEDLRLRMGFDEPLTTEAKKDAPAAAAPAVQVQSIPILDPSVFAQGIAMADDYRRQRETQEANFRAQQQNLASIFEPPSLPTGKEREKLIADENLLAEEFQKRDNWTKNALGTLAQMMGQYVQDAVGQAQQAAMVPAMNLQRSQAMNEAADRIHEMGVKNADEVVALLEQRLRSNPQNYWRTVTDPYVLTQGARLVAEDLARERGLAPAGTVGYDGSTPPARGNVGSDALWARVAKLVGQEVAPQYRERLGSGSV